MGRAFLELLEFLVRSIEDIARLVGRMIESVFNSSRHAFEFAFLPQTLLYLMASWIFVGLAFAAAYLIHTVFARRPVVFISYHHSRLEEALTVRDRIRDAGITADLVEFDTEADHDRLLDRIMTGIRSCDLFICLPGNQESFVDNEVFAAASMQKPIFFCVSGGPESRLPNTAKKGYPVVPSPSRSDFAWNTFLSFCAYIAGGPSANRRTYTAIADYLGRIAWLLVGCYLIAPALVSNALAIPSVPESHKPLVWFAALNACFISIPVAWFLASRFRTRRVLRNVVSNRLFSAEFVPAQLDSSLTRTALFELLVTDEVPAVHQDSETVPELLDHTQHLLDLDTATESQPEAAERRQRVSQSSDPAWQRESAARILASGHDLAIIECPSDLLPDDLNPAFDWALAVPRRGTAFLVARNDQRPESDDNGGAGAFVLFWILWIVAVLNLDINGPFELFLTMLGVLALVFVLVFLGSLLAGPAGSSQAPRPWETERKIQLPDDVWVALYPDDDVERSLDSRDW